jgi:hypothetical protein
MLLWRRRAARPSCGLLVGETRVSFGMDRRTAARPFRQSTRVAKIAPVRAHLLIAACMLAACSGPPKRDVFIPPYAEKGCWAQFYEQADFGPPMRQVEGPMFVEAIPGSIILVPDLERISPQPLFEKARSLIVGPNAMLVGYSETLFRGAATVLDPGTRVQDSAAIGYPGRFVSLTLQCKA